MSHKATNYLASLAASAMTPGEFRVMFHLCDCHNPAFGCFPSQAYLMEHTGLSNGGLNKCLSNLEKKKLIEREKTRHPKTRRQMQTHYILGFEFDDRQDPAPLSGVGAVSTQGADPSPLKGETRLHNSGDIYKDKPVREPVREPSAKADFDFDQFCKDFSEIYPKGQRLDEVYDALYASIEAGADPSHLKSAARQYRVATKGTNPTFISLPVNWLKHEKWKDFKDTSRDPEQANKSRRKVQVDAILNHKGWLLGSISPHHVRELISLDLVTEADCKQAGLQF